MDGQPGLEGYYKEWDHDLAPEERLQFSPGEQCPPFRADLAPRLSNDAWPPARLRKVLRNYAMEYITSIVPEAIAVLGPAEGGHLAGIAARLTGMHTFDFRGGNAGRRGAGRRRIRGMPGAPGARAGRRCGRERGRRDWTVRQTGWRLMQERRDLSPAVFDAWNELWVGAALAHDRGIRLDVVQRRDRGDPVWAWRIRG